MVSILFWECYNSVMCGKRKHRWQQRYLSTDLPWVTNRVDRGMVAIIEAYGIGPGKVLEIGCGYGNNSVWLAQQGFEVTGIDISAEAIQKAKENASDNDVQCEFFTWDFIKNPLSKGPYEFIFDRGCFHSRDFRYKRRTFVKNVFSHLKKGGYWFSLIGSKDTDATGIGPPRLSALEIVKSVEHRFKILELKASVFDSDQEQPRKAWSCLLERR